MFSYFPKRRVFEGNTRGKNAFKISALQLQTVRKKTVKKAKKSVVKTGSLCLLSTSACRIRLIFQSYRLLVRHNICRLILRFCFFTRYSIYSQDTKCAVPICSSIKQKIKLQQVQQRVQQQQLLRRRMAAMNSRITGGSGSGLPSTSGALSPGSSGPNSALSSSSSSLHLGQQHSPHTPGMGGKPGSNTGTPPPSVLQALKQVCSLFYYTVLKMFWHRKFYAALIVRRFKKKLLVNKPLMAIRIWVTRLCRLRS